MIHITPTTGADGTIYKQFGGTCYRENTPDAVIEILDRARNVSPRQRLKIYLGDQHTGRDWHELTDRYCTIGRSTGSIKIPLCIANVNSSGGPALMTDCIVKIVDVATGHTLYQHPKYKAPVVDVVPLEFPDDRHTHAIYIDGEFQFNCKSERAAFNMRRRLL